VAAGHDAPGHAPDPGKRLLTRIERVRRYLADAGHAFERAPVEVTVSVLLAVAFSYAVESAAEPMQQWLELAIVAVLIAGVAFAASLLHGLGAWTTRTRWIVTGAGVAVIALYGVAVLDLDREAEGWRAAALVAGALLLLLAAPAFASDRDSATARFRLVTGRLVLRVLAVGLYALALFAGLALALGAVNTLFELGLDAKIYAHVFGWVFLVLVPWVVVGGIPDYVRPATEPSAVATAVHRMATFLVPPLLAIYYLILYAYAVRIMATSELPKNLVSPLVIAAGLIAVLALVLFDRQDEDGAPIQPLRLAAPLFVPLALLGLYALSQRFGQYGWTEFRALRTVLLIVLGALAAAGSVFVLRRRRLPLYVPPAALAVALILSVVGPWNVLAASRRSQQARLNEALAQIGLDGASTAPRDTVIANAAYDNISSTSRYLALHFGTDALPPVLAGLGDERHMDYAHALGLRRAAPPADARGLYVQLEDGAMLTDAGGGRLTYLRLESFRAPGEFRSGVARADSLLLVMTSGADTITADLAPILDALGPGSQPAALPPEHARVDVIGADGAVRGELMVLEIGFGGQSPRLLRLVGLLRLAPR
jgi:hypothetical protein